MIVAAALFGVELADISKRDAGGLESSITGALQDFRHLGQQSLRGWSQWSLPRARTVVHLMHAPKEYVEHLFQESLRETQQAALEKRRPGVWERVWS